ncbi:hypothetical protein D3C80_1528560 [compost metagenome]
MGESFQILRPSSMRSRSRRSCSSGVTSSQYFNNMMPESTMACSTMGAPARNLSLASWLQKPMTRSTPALLYQLRSKMMISPAAGRWGI